MSQPWRKIGYPIVMKIVSPDILHKSDAGGVVVNIKNEQMVRDAYKKILDNAVAYDPTPIFTVLPFRK